MPNVAQNDWENPQVTGRNKEPGHATLVPYTDSASALIGERSTSPYFILLNGDWKFKLFPNPTAAPDDFYREDYDDRDWGSLAVPGNWQLQGGRQSKGPVAGMRVRLNGGQPRQARDRDSLTDAAADRHIRLDDVDAGTIDQF